MITSQRMINYVSAEPFRPYRVTTAGGQTFEIRHPEMVSVGRSSMRIYTYMSDDPEIAKEREIEVSLLLTESVEPLEAPARPQGST
jgi:hypothetical protein